MSEVGYIFPEDAAKQVVEVGNAIQKTDAQLLKYTEDANKLISILKQQNISFEQLQQAQTKTTKTITELDSIGKSLIQSEEKLKQVTDKRIEQIIKNRAETQKATKEIQLKIRAQQAEKGSIEQLSAVNSILEKRLKAVNLTTDEGRKKADLLRGAIDKNTKKIMANSSEFSRWKINIGNYRSALEGLPGPIGNVVSSTGQIVTAVAKLGPVGAIVAGTIANSAALLLAFFTKSEKGVEMLERKVSGLKAAWGVLVGEMISGGEKIAESFDNVSEQSTFWTKAMSIFGVQGQLIGVRMDLASKSAENYTRVQQDLEDQEREMIVPRAQANQQIKAAMLLYEDETKSMSVRIEALKTAINFENMQADAEIEHQKQVVQNIRTINEEKKKAGQLRDEDEEKLQNAMAKEIELSTQSLGRQLRATTRINTARRELSADYEQSVLKRQKFEDAILEGERKRAEDELKIWAEQVNKKYELGLKEVEIEKAINEKIAQLNEDARKTEDEKATESNEKLIEFGNKIAEKNKEDADKEKEKKDEINKQTFDAAVSLADTLFSMKSANLQREFEMAEGNEKKQKEIAAKMAKNEKNQALFNIAISTATGIMKSIASVGLPAAIPFIVLTTALGAIQAGIVASKPIPKFAKGTEYAPNEFIAGEAGRELIKTKSGDLLMANKATHFKGNKFRGATIYTNRETEQIISQSGKENNFVFDTSDLRDEMRAVKDAITKKPVLITDNSGRVVGKQSNNYRETYLNRMQNGR
jgi:hypothetical protein